MAIEDDWLASFTDLEYWLSAKFSRNSLFIEVGLAFAVLEVIKAFIYFELHLFTCYFDRLSGLAWRLFIQFFSGLQILVAILN